MRVCAVPSITRSHVNTHGSECDCLNPQEISQGKSERCHLRPAWAMPIRPRLVRVRLVGKLPRSANDAWRVPAGRQAMQVCGAMWHASWHRTSARSRRRESVHNLGRTTSP
eukprot:6208433-Pleurochrysis_carterae.AAC.1